MKNDNANNNDKKLHNPKSHAPAVYIPCWLSQVPKKLLTCGAKLVYGRLAQWSTSSGDVFRSAPQLSKELGIPERNIERHIKELKVVELIGTFLPQAGGINHFKFYDHEWMHTPICRELCYEQDLGHESIPTAKNGGGYNVSNPPPKMAVPTAKNGGTPPPKMAVINKKEIKRNKKDHYLGDSSNTPTVIKDFPIKTKRPYEQDDMFMLFYSSYPKKQKPHDAHKEFLKLKLSEVQVHAIVADVNMRLAKDDQWQKLQFIPQPVNYLKGQQWESEINNSKDDSDRKKQENKIKADAKVEAMERRSQQEHDKHIQNTKDAIAGKEIAKQVKARMRVSLKDMIKDVGIKSLPKDKK